MFGIMLFTSLLGPARAEVSQLFESGPAQVHLIELYTSEGCSSCPPAEKWLNQFTTSPDLWKRVVPVAFHVDYWDGLGWPDIFASRAFTERQYGYAAHWGNSSVYTPGIVVDGREGNSTFNPDALSGDASVNAGKLKVQILGKSVMVTFVTTQKFPRTLQCQVALLGNGIRSEIKRGENGGQTLIHDFVVLKMNTASLVATTDGMIYSATLTLPEREVPCRRALAVWVEDPAVGRPLQATGGLLSVE
jgi:hypothetical protein